MAENVELVHATCVAIGGNAVLLRGPSGAGKSDLALRLLYTPLPARFGVSQLVSDDQVQLSVQDGSLTAHTGPNLANKLEVRGTGIVRQETCSRAPVKLVIDAASRDEIPRMPENSHRWTVLLSVRVPRLALALLEPSAVAKILNALDQLQ